MKLLYFSATAFADCDFPVIKEFQKRGYDITYIITMVPYQLRSTLFDIKSLYPQNGLIPAKTYKELEIYSKYIDLDKVYVVNRINSKDSSLKCLFSTIEIIRFIYNNKFDIIHIVDILRFWDMLIYIYFRDKIVQTVHDPFPHSGSKHIKSIIYRKFCFKIVKKIILLNQEQKDFFYRENNINPQKIFINKLGVYDNITYFKDPKIKQDKNNILFFGRISKYKGLDYLCKAMVEVHKHFPTATLTIAGGGKMYFDINEYKNKDYIKIENRYIGMKELSSYLQKCAFVVCPYTDATQSGVVMTSYAMNRPIIATKVGGLPSMIKDGKSGLIIEPKNIKSLEDAIIKLLGNETLVHQMSKYINEELVPSEYSWGIIVDKYIQIYSYEI